MQDCEQRAVTTASLKLSLWLRYVDDTFVIWKYGDRELQSFLDYLNGQCAEIQFLSSTCRWKMMEANWPPVCTGNPPTQTATSTTAHTTIQRHCRLPPSQSQKNMPTGIYPGRWKNACPKGTHSKSVPEANSCEEWSRTGSLLCGDNELASIELIVQHYIHWATECFGLWTFFSCNTKTGEVRLIK